MAARNALLVALVCALAAGGCDFPADPPLKAPVTPPAVEARPHIDSAAALLPLRKGVGWVYMAQPKFMAPQSGIAWVTETVMGGTLYHRAPFTYDLNPVKLVLVLPHCMRQVDRGIAFYDAPFDTLREAPRSPRLMFVLPYPAARGAEWPSGNAPNGPFGMTVTVQAKDTVIADPAGATWHTYRYDVRDAKGERTSLFIVPGKAIVRMQRDDVTIHTMSWIGL
ncbi:MAG: hypothetical protein IPP94_02280 [Ignavibacteria bacterium]|nr:hypothetical protein [Ignavibacteria bacterium]